MSTLQKLTEPFGPTKPSTMSVAGRRFREMILGMRDCDRISHVVLLYHWFKMLVARGENEISCLNALKKLRKDIIRLRGGSLIHSEAWDLFEYAPEDSDVFFDLYRVGFNVNYLDSHWGKHYLYSGEPCSARENQIIQEDSYDAFLEEEERQERIESSSIAEDPLTI